MAPSERCDICGSGERPQRHSENYFNPLQVEQICGPSYLLIHLRVWRWHEWQALCRKNDPSDRKWFSMLEIDQPDVAGYLRAKCGPDAGNLKQSPLFTVPDKVARALEMMAFQT